MKILLIQVPTSHLGAGERVYPLGLSRIAKLIPAEHKKWSLDMNLSMDPWLDLRNMIIETEPDAAALSFRNIDPLAGHHASYMSSIVTSARMIKALSPATQIIAGGPVFSLFGKRLLQEIPEIDCCIIGEGELAVPHLFADDAAKPLCPNLVWRNGACIEVNPFGPYVCMDVLPAIDTECFRPEDYVKENKYVAAMGIEGKRGCDLNCAYCIYPQIGGRKLRLRNPKKIVDELEYLHKRHGIDLFHFTDSVVNRPLDHFEAVCRDILARKLDIKWTGFFREDTLSENALQLAVDSGLVAVYFSADALTDAGLKLLNKRLSKEHILNAARITANNGILTMCHFLVNLPGETSESFQEARDLLNRILDIHSSKGNLGAVIFNNVRLYPHAALTKRIINDGLIDPGVDLLYPTYFNPPSSAHILHEFEIQCHSAGVFSRFGIGSDRLEV